MESNKEVKYKVGEYISWENIYRFICLCTGVWCVDVNKFSRNFTVNIFVTLSTRDRAALLVKQIYYVSWINL